VVVAATRPGHEQGFEVGGIGAPPGADVAAVEIDAMDSIGELAALSLAGAPADPCAALADPAGMHLLEFDRASGNVHRFGFPMPIAQAIAHMAGNAAQRQVGPAA